MFQDQRNYFPQLDARLPIKLKHGGVTWITWGRRKEEAIGKFPNGGWARLDSIKMGKWKPWHPRPVLILAECFMEKDHDKQSHWITLAPGMAIQALLAERDGEKGSMWLLKKRHQNTTGFMIAGLGYGNCRNQNQNHHPTT